MTGAWRIDGFDRGPAVRFRFDDQDIDGFAGESVAVALACAGRLRLRTGPGDRGPRAAFCHIGACQECVVVANGVRTEACRLRASDGLVLYSVS